MAVSKAKAGMTQVLRIGIHEIIPITLNPTKKALEGLLKRTLEKEPEYVKDVKNEKTGDEYKEVSLRIWFKTKEALDYINSITFKIRNTPRLTSDKIKAEYMDITGKTLWLPLDENSSEYQQKVKENETAEAWKAFDFKTKRQTLFGESDLIRFIKKINNLGNKEEARLDKIMDLFKGNFNEVKESIIRKAEFSDAPITIKVLLGVNNGYQDFFNGAYLSPVTSKKDLEYFQNTLNKNQKDSYAWKADFPADLKPKVYNAEDFMHAAAKGNMQENNPLLAGLHNLPTSNLSPDDVEEGSDDLPF